MMKRRNRSLSSSVRDPEITQQQKRACDKKEMWHSINFTIERIFKHARCSCQPTLWSAPRDLQSQRAEDFEKVLIISLLFAREICFAFSHTRPWRARTNSPCWVNLKLECYSKSLLEFLFVDDKLSYSSVATFVSFTENATKFCRDDGSWEKSFYDLCIKPGNETMPPQDVEYNTLIYCIGYSISIVALSLAVIIFLHFKWVECLLLSTEGNLREVSSSRVKFPLDSLITGLIYFVLLNQEACINLVIN